MQNADGQYFLRNRNIFIGEKASHSARSSHFLSVLQTGRGVV